MRAIGEIAEVFDGPHATPKKIEFGPYFLSISSLINGSLDLSKSAHLSEVDYIKWTRRVTPQEGDLLFSYETRLGEAALMPKGVKACLGRRMGLIRPNRDKILPEYLLYAYLSPAFQGTIVSNTIRGATVDRLSLNEIPKFKIRVPSLLEQKVVSELLSAIDKKIKINNHINTELETTAKTLYDYWFVQFDFPDESGRPYKSSGGKMVYSEELRREIPVGWKVSNILKVADLFGGGTPSKENSSFWNGEIPFFTPTDAGQGIFQLDTGDHITEDGLKNCSSPSFDKGTVLITARGSVGKLVLTARKMAMNQSCYALKPKDDCGGEFLYFLAQELIHHLKIKSSGSVFKSIVSNDIKLTKVCIPDNQLIQDYSKIVDSLFGKVLNCSKENQQLAELRDWLLPMLMNGQVRVEITTDEVKNEQ